MNFWIKSIVLVITILELEPSYCSRFHGIRHDGNSQHQHHFLSSHKQQRKRDVLASMNNSTVLSPSADDIPSFNNYGFDEMQIEMAKALYVNIRNELKKAVDMRLNNIVKQYENEMLDRQNNNRGNNNNNQNLPVQIGNNNQNNNDRYGPIRPPVPPVNPAYPHESINAKYIQQNGPFPQQPQQPRPFQPQPPPQIGYPNPPQPQQGNQQQWGWQNQRLPPGHHPQGRPFNQLPPQLPPPPRHHPGQQQQQQQFRPPQG